MKHGAVVIAAITSCNNTSNPSVMVAAGLVAKKAAEKGLNVKPYVKTSLAPGSRVVTEYLKAANLLAPNVGNGANFDLSAISLLIRDWSTDTALVNHTLATILLTENLNDLSPLLVTNHRACRIPILLPTASDLASERGILSAELRYRPQQQVVSFY